MQNRFRSWALWVSLASLIVFCAKEFFGVDIAQTVDTLLDMILPILVAFGIINNPTQKDKI